MEGVLLQSDDAGNVSAITNINRIETMVFPLLLDDPSVAEGFIYADITGTATEPSLQGWQLHVTEITPNIREPKKFSGNNGSWAEYMRPGDSVSGKGGKVEETGTYDDGRHYALVRFDKFDYYAIVTDEKTFFKGDIVDFSGTFSHREVIRHSSKAWDVSVIVYMDDVTATLAQ